MLAGIIIGAGIFSLPYFAERLGLVTAVFYLVFFAAIYMLVYFMYSDVVKSDSGRHRFAYFAKKLLPKRISSLAPWVVLGSMVFAMTVYIILAPAFATLFMGQDMGLIITLAFWMIGSAFIFAKIFWLEWAEILGILSILAIVVVVFFSSFSMPFEVDYFKPIKVSLLLLPFGAIIFAFSGRAAIAKMVEIWREAKGKGRPFSLKGSIIAGTLLPAFIYILFIVGVLRLSISVTPEGLDSVVLLSPIIMALLGGMGIITLWTSYFIIGLNVKEIMEMDFKIPRILSGTLVVFLPILLYLSGVQNFIVALSIAGGLFASIEVIFIVLMWNKVRERANKIVTFLVLATFILAIISVFTIHLI